MNINYFLSNINKQKITGLELIVYPSDVLSSPHPNLGTALVVLSPLNFEPRCFFMAFAGLNNYCLERYHM